jgi:hypothetical protein
MIGKIIGAAVGRRLASRNEGGTGMLLGAMAPAIGKRLFGPVGLVIGGAWVAKKVWDRRRATRAPAAYSGGPVV